MPLSPPPPPLTSTSVPTPEDAEHLRLLSIFHYIVGALGFVFGSFPLIHVAFGMFMVFAPLPAGNAVSDMGPKFFGLFFVVIGLVVVLFAWLMALCTIFSGRYIASRRRRNFSVVVACILCVFVPFGTVLGVFTLLVLSRPSVKQAYGAEV